MIGADELCSLFLWPKKSVGSTTEGQEIHVTKHFLPGRGGAVLILVLLDERNVS